MRSYDKGYCFKQNGWIYLHIEGQPYERGFQHGYLLAAEIAEALNAIKYYIYFTTGKHFQFFVAHAERMFKPFLQSTEFEEELQGISAGAHKAGIPIFVKELVAFNSFLELYDFWWPWKQKHSSAEKICINKCSAFIAAGKATKNNSIVMAHNTWYDFIFGQNFNIVADLKPSAGNRILMQTMPGYLASMSDFFLTSGGLVGTETTIQINDYNENGKPEFLRAREAMQYASTIKEWVEIMEKGNNGGLANSWLLGDIRTNKIARLELGLKYTDFEQTENSIYTGFNAPENPEIRNLEYAQKNDYFDIRSEIGARRVRFSQLAKDYYGKIDAAIAKKIIADHYDIYLNTDNPSSRTICCHSDNDRGEFPSTPSPYSLHGALDGKVLDTIHQKMQFEARWGRPCGIPFNADDYLTAHPEWAWQKDYLRDMPAEDWTMFTIGMKD
ncbi:MAG: C45 family autoproteolytic acyltransferase/hydrolase [Pelosinus sp.]|nr:C45 family autoproteolytic acyltransferase/hydrolase [Pelosinus sp.]